jgi:hypothetical protein
LIQAVYCSRKNEQGSWANPTGRIPYDCERGGEACGLAKAGEKGELLPRMEMLRKTLAHRNVRIGLVFLSLAGLVGVWILWKTGIDLASLKEVWTKLNDYLVKHPGALFLALVLLPGLPIPTSALLFTAGVVWRHDPVMAVSLSMLAIAINLTWTYWLAAGPARRLVEKLLAATAVQIPDLPRGDHLRLIPELPAGIPACAFHAFFADFHSL